MSSTDYHRSQTFLNNFGRSIMNMSRENTMIYTHEPTTQDHELEAFQQHVAQRFHSLSTTNPNEILSISWICDLLDVFSLCQDEFKLILMNNKEYLSKPPMEKLVNDFFDRNVKALDVCNAIREGIQHVMQWQKQLEIVLCALDNGKILGEGQFRRAKKALDDIAFGMLDEKESLSSVVSHRNRSFGRNNNSHKDKYIGHLRSMSWSVSRSWSAARQLLAIGNNLVAPKGNEIMATNGMSLAVFTMNNVLLFVMWALVAAIPCQDRGLQTNFHLTRQFIWTTPIISLHERILEESKRRERKTACGLLKEIHEIEKCARIMNELTDSVTFPLTEETEGEVRQRVYGIGLVYDKIKDELEPMERKVREVFHKIVRSRTEGLEYMGRSSSQ